MGRIVVGVDGSEGSHQALRWAAEEARLRGAALEVVHTYPPPQLVGVVDGPVPLPNYYAASAEVARELVQGMTASIEGVEVHGHALESPDPAQTLVERSADADMLVVSSRGRGGFRSLLLGSVSQKCAQHATCPVVIVRAGSDEPAN